MTRSSPPSLISPPAPWATLLAASPLPLAYVDARLLVWLATPAWRAWFGLPATGGEGQPYGETLSAARASRHLQHLEIARRGVACSFEDGEEDAGASDGPQVRRARIDLTPDLQDADSTGHGVLLSLVDLTGERQRDALIAEQSAALSRHLAERQRSEAMAAELEKVRTLLDWRTTMLQERNEMLQLLSHEIRQPLNNASAAMQATMKAVTGLQSVESQQASSALMRAEHVLQQVIGTLDNTLAAGTILADGKHPLSDTDLPTLVNLAVHDIAADMRARIRVDRRTGTRTVQLNPALMRLSLRNLLNNALAYSPPEHDVVLCIDETEEPLALLIEVIDSGPGIPEELRPRLFDKGSRGANARHRPGVGLGLFIVNEVARLHRGTVQALPGPQGGTIMRLTLPQGLAS